MAQWKQLGSQRTIVALAGMLACVGCRADEGLPEGTCRAVVWAIPERNGTELDVIGEWDDWADAIAMTPFTEAPWHVADFALPPGEYGYLVVEDGEGRLDATNPLGGFRASDGLEVSWLEIADCERPRIEVESVATDADGSRVALAITPAHRGGEVERDDVIVTIDGMPMDATLSADDELALPPLLRGRHVLEVSVVDRDGIEAAPARAIVWSDPVAPRLDDAIVYQVVVDRFRGEGGSVLAPPPTIGTRAGGTLGGVQAELERGTFDELGVSTLWISPVYLVPDEARPARDDPERLIDGYHGYWPVDTRVVDPRIGGEAALHSLVAAAHARGIEVLLDVVPNHYDETNPRVAQHTSDGWFNHRDPPCICGGPDCPWETQIETCWFTPYLPDVRLQHRDALAAAIADAVWLQSTFAADGFRFDAVPMMPRAATRRLLHALRRDAGPRGATTHVGEVFTGSGDAGIEAIRYHLGEHGLDSAFDFPLMWAIREAAGGGARGFDALAELLDDTDAAIEGSGAVMARMLGNHDTSRVASALAGDVGDPWTAPPPQPDDSQVYARLRLAFGVLFTLPGAPVLYYGDEIGLAGGNDPDCRRVMPDPAGLAPVQLELRAAIARFARLRRCLPALRRGARIPVGATVDHLAFVRDAGDGDPALVVLSRADGSTTLSVPAVVAPGWYKDAVSGERVELTTQGARVELAPFDVKILVREDHACVAP